MTRLFAGTQFDIPPRCDRCNELVDDCECPPPAKELTPPEKQTAKVRVDQRKHKRKVTIVWGLAPEENDMKELLSQLKSACGAGGSIQDEQLEIQGDHMPAVKRKLGDLGYRVR